MTPVYLSQVLGLRQNDEKTCNMMKDVSFYVAKSEVPCTSIGMDHGIERGNRALKVLGGIKGLAN